jgi:predicted alpha/beta hydrolase family esterase
MFGRNRSSTNSKASSEEVKRIIGLQEIKGCSNPDRNGDVIFVHGLGGNLRSTWHPEGLQDDNFWLNWLSQDSADIGIWSFGYKAEPFEWRGKAMPLFDQASNLLEWLEIKDLSERPLIFVTHSLGGLLVKKMLSTAQTFKKQKLIEQIKGIVFLATPHTGSHLANLINNIGALTRTTISVEELKAHSPQLRELNEWYRENVRSFGIATKVYYETISVHGVLVVDEDSANPGIEGVKPVSTPEDHITIAKPSSRNDLVYGGVKRFILENFKPSHSNCEMDAHPIEKGNERFLKLRVHRATLIKSRIECYFVNLTNLSPTKVLEVTHIWYEDEEKHFIPLTQPSRRLPVRLELDQSWETWIPVENIPRANRDNAYQNFCARISTGAIFKSEFNPDVPPCGTIPGGFI